MAMDITKLLGPGVGVGGPGMGAVARATQGAGGLQLDPALTSGSQDAETPIQTTGFIGQDFGNMLKQAIGALGELGATADENALKMATGEPIDIHEVMLSMEHASLGFSTALSVRNKLVEAYQEIMRMSV